MSLQTFYTSPRLSIQLSYRYCTASRILAPLRPSTSLAVQASDLFCYPNNSSPASRRSHYQPASRTVVPKPASLWGERKGSNMAAAGPIPRVVGDLSCQRDSYLRSLTTQVVSCSEYTPPPAAPAGNKSKGKTKQAIKEASKGAKQSEETEVQPKSWLLEFSDSVLFPEGGGQPTDHGTIKSLATESTGETIPVTKLERHGLRCIAYSPQPLAPGTSVQQDVDFQRRMDHMQQHTGQHLLSAIMDKMDLETLGWGMGAAGEMNYVELPRKPSDEEMRLIQEQCNKAIRDNMPISVETPKDMAADNLPDDYDKEKGVVRYIRIGDLDFNACCGTHLKQTSHISLILLHHTQPIRSTNCRLYFTCGDRAINMATTSINAFRNLSVSLSAGSAPSDVQGAVQRLNENLSASRKKEKKLLAEIASYESERIKSELKQRNIVHVHRPTDGLEFLGLIEFEIKAGLKDAAVLLTSGEDKTAGSVMILGDAGLVDKIAAKVKENVSTVKGGGKGKWQGKVLEWKKGEVEALTKAVEDLTL